MKKGFTLAEVLITLSIIGIIASFTLPSIVKNSAQKRYEVARTKAKSSVLNGYKKMLSYYGLTSISDLPLWNCKTKECFSNEHKKVFSIVSDSTDDYVVAKFNTKKMYGAAYALTFEQNYKSKNGSLKKVNWGELPYSFITNDGMIFGITNIDYENNYSFDVVVDTNCSNNPNKVGVDYTEFTLDAYWGTIEEKSVDEDSLMNDDLNGGNNNSSENLDDYYPDDNNSDDNNNDYPWLNDDDHNDDNDDKNDDDDDHNDDDDDHNDDEDDKNDDDDDKNDDDDDHNNDGKNCNGKGNPNCTGNVNSNCHGTNNPNCTPNDKKNNNGNNGNHYGHDKEDNQNKGSENNSGNDNGDNGNHYGHYK